MEKSMNYEMQTYRPQYTILRTPKNGPGFPKIRSSIMGVPIIRIIVFGGLYWGPLFWETPIYIYI